MQRLGSQGNEVLNYEETFKIKKNKRTWFDLHFIKLTMAIGWKMDYNPAKMEAGRPVLRLLQS